MSLELPTLPDPSFVEIAEQRAERSSLEVAVQRLVFFLVASVPSFVIIAIMLGPSALSPQFETWLRTSTAIAVLAVGAVAIAWPKHRQLSNGSLAGFAIGACALPIALPWSLVSLVVGPLTANQGLLVSVAVLVIASAAVITLGPLHRWVTVSLVGLITVPNVLVLAIEFGLVSLPTTLLFYGMVLATAGSFMTRRSNTARERLLVRTETLLHTVDSERANLAELNAELEHRATHDLLMGIPNRFLFRKELSRALHPSQEYTNVGLLFCDLDRFKYVNDTFGHQAGDQLLIAVGKRIQSAISDEDAMVARVGGDELVVLMRKLEGPDHLDGVAAKLLAKFSDSFSIDGNELNIAASIGAAQALAGVAPDELIAHADAALYEAKQRGRNQAVRADQALRARRSVWSRSERKLRTAIDHHDVEGWLKPEVDLITGEVVAAEAVAHWRVDGEVETAESFIEVARKGGLLEPLMFSMVDQIWAWRMRSGSTVPVGLNVTIANLAALIDAQDVSTSSRPLEGLRLEIAEPDIVSDIDYIVEVLQSARALGAEVFVDNFGRGNSSLRTLADLPLDGVKIAQTMIDRVETDVRVRQLVTLLAEFGRECGVAVVAEGVENGTQADFLARVGIDRALGRLFSPALETDDFDLACELGCGSTSLSNLF